MPKQLSNTLQRTINAVSARESVVVLLEIDHELLVQPIRVANYSNDIVSNGDNYTALRFNFSLPSDLAQGLPTADLSIDNVQLPPEENSIAEWLDLSDGGAGATVRMMGVLPSDPDNLEFDITMNLANLSVTPLEIRGTLNYEDILNRPAIFLKYRPDTAPGLW